ncbi:MAG: ATP-dependent helicase HrpB [Planctomycetaceae bacterium]
MTPLPIDDVLPELTAVLQVHNCALQAPAGAGKTTRVPPALLRHGLADGGQIVMLEPRRIAARTAARRMAAEMNQKVGGTVGYRIRFDDAVSKDTRILVVTEGVLLRKLQDDPFLEDVSVVVFDEFHERRLDSDLALAMTRRLQQTVRPELRILAMSATLNAAPVAEFLGNCPVISSPGRMFPVAISYLPSPPKTPMTTQAVTGVLKAVQKTDGDILVFLPGVGEILKTAKELQAVPETRALQVMTLFGDMSAEDQDRVLAPAGIRKVVLSTNVAETSVTIEGVTAVVDTGYARQMQFDAAAGLNRLELTPISKASADQRAGRAGRTGPGICLRLWDEGTHRARRDHDVAELQRVDLSSAVLNLHAWGEHDVRAFPWFESPSEQSIEHAERLLTMLEALTVSSAEAGSKSLRITALGRQLSSFPLAPRLARLLCAAAADRETDRASLLAAMLSERSVFMTRRDGTPSISGAAHGGGERQSDVLDRLQAVEKFLATGQTSTPFGEINIGAARQLQQVAGQLKRLAAGKAVGRQQNTSAGSTVLLKSLLAAFPDRLARRRDVGSDRGLMVGGRGVRLNAASVVRSSDLFLCVDVDGAGTDANVRLASMVSPEWLDESLLTTADELFFHPSQQQVAARRRVRFLDLLLDETPVSVQNDATAAQILFEAASGQWKAVMPADSDAVENFILRTQCLATWMPELQLPSFDSDALREVLRDLCHGKRSFRDLKQANWLAALERRLNYPQLQAVNQEAPERLMVPSGSRIRLMYELDRPPVLAVRIQEVFGLKQTPRVAGGRIPVLLHLLAPNMRPQQITDDLASFWANTYPEVKKELKRRYPKHPWPDDPLAAPAIRKG